ncbi:MAG: tyrosine-type recombinase/integrase [Candidatus Eremiobacteraeota bacterium]|nr:tyrosine-type recombinase/integrase [Candidatus Eremiobacteraeota bacterium]
MSERLPPKEMAKKITRLLKKQDPDYGYLKKVFAQVRESLGLKGKITRAKKLPELLTDDEMKCFCEAVREENHRVHTVMIKLLIYTGVRNSELANIQIDDVDVKRERIRIDQGKGKKDRYVPFPSSFKGELAQYIMSQKARRAHYLFETHRNDKFTTRWIREIVSRYGKEAGIEKRVYPHLFRHHLLTHLARHGIVDSKMQLVSGHSDRKSLSVYQDLSLGDVAEEYQSAMKDFPDL